MQFISAYEYFINTNARRTCVNENYYTMYHAICSTCAVEIEIKYSIVLDNAERSYTYVVSSRNFIEIVQSYRTVGLSSKDYFSCSFMNISAQRYYSNT